MKKRIGVFGGSFDPIHFGHLNLIIGFLEECHLDQIFLFPALVSAFKVHAPPSASIAHRLKMVELATAPITGCQVFDWESHSPSYTIETIRKLSKDSDLELHLLMGEDHFSTFDQWKEAEELAQLAPPFIAKRMNQNSFIHSKLKENKIFNVVNLPLFDISSTRIRERLLKKRYCGHLVPTLVLDYIQQHQLYC